MKKILVSLVAGVAMTAMLAFSAMAAGDTTADADDAVAKIGDDYYTSVYDAIVEVADGETVELLKSVTIADWQMLEEKSFSLDGNNHTITISSVTKNTLDNGGALIRNTTADELNISDVAFILPERAVVAYTVGGIMDNVTVTGGRFGFAVNAATNFFGCTFNGQTSEAIYFKDLDGAPGSVVDGCTFNLENARACALWSNEEFTNNTINYDGDAITGVTILSNSSATVSENIFSEDTKVEIYVNGEEQGSFSLTKNVIPGDVFTDGSEITTQFDNVTIENNTLSDAALEGLQAVKSDVVSVAPVATVGGKDYYSLQDAVDNAANGATITVLDDIELSETAYESPKNPYQFKGYYGVMIPADKEVVIDLNGKTISYKDTYGGCDSSAVYNIGKLTITDSSAGETGKISYVDVADNVTYNQNHAVIFNVGTLTVEGGTIEHLDTGNGTVSDAIDNNSNISYNYGNDAICTINGGTIIGAEYRAIRQYTHYNEGVDNRVEINGGTIMGGIYMQHGDSWYYANPESNRLNVNCELEINGGTITTLDGGYGHIRSYLNNPDNEEWSIEINGGTIEVPVQIQIQRGVFYTNGVSGATTPAEAAGTRNTEWLEENGGFISGGTFKYAGDPDDVTTNLESFLVDGLTLIPGGSGFVPYEEALLVETIELEFADVTEATARGEKLYNINLVADNAKTINRLNSVDLSFVLTQISGTNEYEIIASNDEIAINPVNNSENRYEFHYKNKDDAVNTDTATTITIGQVKFTGYGKFSFAVDSAATTNAAHATTIYDNIVDTFVPGGVLEDGTEVGEFDITDDTITEVEIFAPTQKLTIKVAFPNTVENNALAYQAMNVTVTGEDIADISIDLGTDNTGAALTLTNKTEAAYTVAFDDAASVYTVEITNALTANTAYNVTVTGAGYRTARYTVNTQETDKVLNFWNNVKDNAVEVEEDKASSAKNVTFLAGDIVKDSTINIYDLSAVVSYFGETMSTEVYNAYAKYDLNRDGKIDSKDVAYVLVSWNN